MHDYRAAPNLYKSRPLSQFTKSSCVVLSDYKTDDYTINSVITNVGMSAKNGTKGHYRLMILCCLFHLVQSAAFFPFLLPLSSLLKFFYFECVTKRFHTISTDYSQSTLLLHRTTLNFISPELLISSPPHLRGFEFKRKCCLRSWQSLPASSEKQLPQLTLKISPEVGERPFQIRPVQSKSLECQKLSPPCLKAQQKLSKRAVVTISTNSLLPFA